ncbi:AbgT family transporter [Candidatus Epulonipiscium viviparus]|uniref:AbgT family transporter n=1 Tax=Candidatus Epulonipiscium viviparus TaxID=420336 RepID=UPI00273816A6|nr:AbgT family transporter [Candidatus Epulopiscium viviparus]
MKRKTLLTKTLDKIEQAGNALPHPTTIFIILIAVVIVASAICAALGVSVTYDGYDQATGQIVEMQVTAVSLLSAEGIRHMFTSIIPNFTGFYSLGPVFMIILCVAVAEGTGLLTALLKRVTEVTPKKWVTAMIVFLGVISNVASSTGYVVLVPLGAIIFMGFKRHPIAGLAAAFAGVSGGWSANLLIGTNDPMFAGISTQAANILDPNYLVQPTANWYFMIASTFLIVILGTLVTEKIVEPRLGAYEKFDLHEIEKITDLEKRGMRWAGIALLAYIILIALLVVPPNGILRNPETNGILVSPFMNSIIPIMAFFFLVPGIFYGIGSKVIKNDKDVIELMTKGITSITGFLVLVFFGGQFINFFDYSKLGTIISVNGAQFLQNTGFVGLPLIIAFIILTSLINIIIAVDSAKWVLMAPIFVPMFMQIGLSPELTQLVFRIGDSCTNVIAPLMPFFALIVAFCQKYDKKAGVGTLVTTMLPYSIAFLIGWTILFVIWYLVGLPIGPGSPLFYTF